MKRHLRIHPKDNVAIALEPLEPGDRIEVDGKEIAAAEPIPQAHKMAVGAIAAGEAVVKYGMPIGNATEDIAPGRHMHVHNLKTGLGEILEYGYAPAFESFGTSLPERKVHVYERSNGEVGIRNELWVVPTVGCVNGVAQRIIDRFRKEVDPVGIDGVFAFPHPYGCSQMGEDHAATRTTLQDIAKHPNAGGVLVLGLGCENNQVQAFRETMGEYDTERVVFLVAQEEEDEIGAGVQRLKALYERMKEDRRVEKPLGVLRIGLECGGSDGLSGITANPLLGEFSDYLVSYGGTTVLTEVPEMFGAETILMNRCIDGEVFRKTVEMVNDFKDYYQRHGQVIYENPSPGNKKGGITTLEDKSLGCTQKAGRSQVMDVLGYGERLKTPGLNLLSAPGNDLVATTALGMAGCHMVLFSTGRGTPFGGFVPTMKISTNTDLARKKPGWIDFDAGQLIGQKSMPELL
ncbi:UxaA family hydrolase, partial [Anaerotalea alkaliphila]